ncbi:MAG: hypothetical protein Q9225_003465 [Loekoesia sp. 1 TL-2023]
MQSLSQSRKHGEGIADSEAPMQPKDFTESRRLDEYLSGKAPLDHLSQFQSTLPLHIRLQNIQCLSEGLFPPVLLQYIMVTQNLRLSGGYYRILYLWYPQRDISHTALESEKGGHDYSTVERMRQELLQSIESLKEEKMKIKRQCVLAGHSTYEVDAILANATTTENIDEHMTHEMDPINHQDMFEIRKHTQDLRLLDGWSNTRDRINRWLLPSLRSDER